LIRLAKSSDDKVLSAVGEDEVVIANVFDVAAFVLYATGAADTGVLVLMIIGAPDCVGIDVSLAVAVGEYVSVAFNFMEGLRLGGFDGIKISVVGVIVDGKGAPPFACTLPNIETILSNFARLSSFEMGFPQS
jgi:hypothetical protein